MSNAINCHKMLSNAIKYCNYLKYMKINIDNYFYFV
jgi:hypothetical protein